MINRVDTPPHFTYLLRCFPTKLTDALTALPENILTQTEELRLSAARPVLIYRQSEGHFLTDTGALTDTVQNAVTLTARQLDLLFRQLCENSIYAKEEDIRQGFLSLPGGHRVGICGSTTVRHGEVTFIKEISALNIRIAHQVIGCANSVIRRICPDGAIHNTLIVSPPGVGKTTLLRDIARILGNTYKIGIADERGEIAAVHQGVAQNDIGLRSVVMDRCPKAVAIGLMIRSMGIECLITDEIGSAADVRAIETASCAGIRTIATAHGADLADLRAHPQLRSLLPLFSYFVFLQKSNGSRIQKIIYNSEEEGG